ncbi:hypothetical protein AWN76_007655 [Rhodothermaceae bacterium RA]|nr:hypothetical protein AWN76_007655 [Rhodothermaceae bacterium RA]
MAPSGFRRGRVAVGRLLGGLLGLWLVLWTGAGLRVEPAAAQEAPSPLPRIEAAETMFEQALRAFRQEEYGIAARRFEEAYTQFGFHRKTTAAMLMAGKALYRSGQYEAAIRVLDDLMRTYPTSRYVDEARRVAGYARQYLEGRGAVAQPLQLGIALPLTEDDVALSQAMFNGIRLAVEEYNEAPDTRRPIRMVFRDTGNDPARARAAVQELAEANVDVVIGPLFSEEARAAAAAAERARVPLVVPLDASNGVAEGRDYVFQANPTLTMRGRLMARFAVRNLRLRDFAVVAEFGNAASERMAEGFQDEVLREGAALHYFKLLPSAADWYRLPEEVGPDTLANVEALYLPIAGARATTYVGAALSGLARMGVSLRVLGNSAWHDLPMAQQASAFSTTYANIFEVNPDNPAVRAFLQRFRALTGEAPAEQNQRLVYTGYDVARYLTHHLAAVPRSLPDALRAAEPYEGLALRLDFREGPVNQGVFFHRYRLGQIDRLR